MALRSVLGKMPAALGPRSPPMRTVRGLSPPAGSRPFASHGGPGGEIITEESLARQRERIIRMEADFWKGMEEIRETRLFFSKLIDDDIEANERSKRTLRRFDVASVILGVPAVIYILSNLR